MVARFAAQGTEQSRTQIAVSLPPQRKSALDVAHLDQTSDNDEQVTSHTFVAPITACTTAACIQ